MSTTLTLPVTKPKLTAPEKKAVTAAEEAFITKPKPAKLTKAPKSLADEEIDYFKILMYGHSGTGKTLTVKDLLLSGLEVLVLSTDTGGHGLLSVSQALKELGRAELLRNCKFYEFTNYDEVEDFVFNPKSFYPEIFTSHDFDVVFWDGFSNFQMSHIDDKVMSLTPSITNAGEARDAGLWSNQQDWGQIKKATLKVHNKFLQLKNQETGKEWHKIVTSIENKAKEDKLTGEIQVAPLLQGAAASLIEPAYDLIFRTRSKKVTEGTEKKHKFLYELKGTEKILAKTRGLVLPSVMDADFGKLWTDICTQRGVPTGKK
jgi:hypothetical protein